MDKYIGTKIIEAKPMTAEEAKNVLDRPIDTNNADSEGNGYLVKYPDGYTSWSPKKAFEKAYRKTDNMTFGLAIEAMRKDKKVARKGWNGKDMFIYLSKGQEIKHEDLVPGVKEKLSEQNTYKIRPRIDMKAADGSVVIGWLASQTDMLAEDWEVI